jgi:hypothetical protein
MNDTPSKTSYDVVIVGGAMYGTAEWITHGEYRSLDLTPFHYERIERNEPFNEKAVL